MAYAWQSNQHLHFFKWWGPPVTLSHLLFLLFLSLSHSSFLVHGSMQAVGGSRRRHVRDTEVAAQDMEAAVSPAPSPPPPRLWSANTRAPGARCVGRRRPSTPAQPTLTARGAPPPPPPQPPTPTPPQPPALSPPMPPGDLRLRLRISRPLYLHLSHPGISAFASASTARTASAFAARCPGRSISTAVRWLHLSHPLPGEVRLRRRSPAA